MKRVQITAIAYEVDLDPGAPIGVVLEGQPVSSGPAPGTSSVKAGILSPGDFSGTPLTATVTFNTPYDTPVYAIVISGVDQRIFTYSGQTESGFTIQTNADDALTGKVSWLASLQEG